MNKKGVSIIAAMITMLVLAAMGSGMIYFVASNQQSRVQQVTSDQAFYTSQSGLEFALGQILEGGSSETGFTRNFSGETMTITRTGGKINVTTAEKGATEAHSITDPSPPVVDCLNVDTSAAAIAADNVRLIGIKLNRKAGCTSDVVITSMSLTTWAPNNGELLDRIQIGADPVEFSGPAAGSGGAFDFGANDYTINNDLIHDLTEVRWTSNITNHDFQLHFNYTYNGSNYSKVANVDFLADDQANCFSWNVGSARLTTESSLWRRLTGTTVSNSCALPIRLDRMTVSWSPDAPARNLNQVVINSDTIYNGAAGSGVEINVDDIYPATSTQPVDYFHFDSEMLAGGRNYSITWTFSDQTSRVTGLNLFNANEHDCLDISTTNAYIDPTNLKRIKGLTIQNTCAADIGMTSLTLSWAAEATRRLTQSVIDDTDGVNTYNSNAASGIPVDFGDNDLYLRDGDGVKNIQWLEFNNNVTAGLAFTLLFTMADGNTKSVTFTPGTQALCLSVNTAAANIAGSKDVDLLGITITNQCSYVITWDRVVVSWVPLAPSRTLNSIVVAGITVWSGPPASSGTNIDITTNVGLNSSETKTITRFRFSGDMSGRTFTIQFIMLDGSSKTTPAFTPPDG